MSGCCDSTRNLLHNAVRHARTAANWRWTLRCDAHRTALTISDCGPGIEPERQRGCFNHSQRAMRSGSGLGLAICQEIVQAWEEAPSPTAKQGTRILGLDAVVRLPFAQHFASAAHSNPAQLSE